MNQTIRDLDEAAARLLAKYAEEPLHSEIAGFINVCRENCTGNYHWRFVYLVSLLSWLIDFEQPLY
jgi:hypothetical protein